jgi:hypothetical protein
MANEFEGYCLNDITYCIDPKTNDFFAIRVVKVGRKFLDVVSLNDRLTLTIAPEFNTEQKNRRFICPKLPNISRFGGFDERIVNAERESGQELRILPFHYWTDIGNAIIERNADEPEVWPIPTGIVYDRWFKHAIEKKKK